MTSPTTPSRPRIWKLLTASASLAAAIIFCPIADAASGERIVILAPAAADVILRLNADAGVVGVTAGVAEFPAATRVGTHRNPAVETIAALKPTLLITGAAFDPDLARRLGAGLFVYDPRDLAGIIAAVRALGIRLGMARRGEEEARSLEAILENLRTPARQATVLYETRANPLSLAKGDSLIRDLLERAGLRYAHPRNAGLVSAEYVLARQPDYYLYQTGPMNKNPVPPPERPGWTNLRSCVWRVDEFAFARPGPRVFETLRELNAILAAPEACAAGREHWEGTR